MENVDDPEDIERCLISRNRAYLSQAQGTPFTITPLKNLLGKDSFTPFENSLLLGTADLNKLPLSSLQKLYLSEIKKSLATLSSPLYHHISLTDMTQGFKKWKESTTISPSTRHLGRYTSFLVSDGKVNDTDYCSFKTKMLQTFNIIINVTIKSGHPLKR